jgi:hypothetical protein
MICRTLWLQPRSITESSDRGEMAKGANVPPGGLGRCPEMPKIGDHQFTSHESGPYQIDNLIFSTTYRFLSLPPNQHDLTLTSPSSTSNLLCSSLYIFCLLLAHKQCLGPCQHRHHAPWIRLHRQHQSRNFPESREHNPPTTQTIYRHNHDTNAGSSCPTCQATSASKGWS